MAGAASLTYCGGIPGADKTGDYVVSLRKEGIRVDFGMFKSKYTIPYENITNVSIKTDEQISKDVTIGRLLLLGVFAFGAKKKTKNTTNYLVIDYSENGVSTSAIFTGKDVPSFHASLLKMQQALYKKNGGKNETVSIQNSINDPYSEIEKLHDLMEKGIISKEEFDEKKKQLLGL